MYPMARYRAAEKRSIPFQFWSGLANRRGARSKTRSRLYIGSKVDANVCV